MDPDILTTTQAANLLHCSRQHVVHLCDTGQLPHTRAGRHRRIRRRDVEQLIHPPIRRDTEQSLWLHIALAAKLVQDPIGVIERAKERLRFLRNVHSDGSVDYWYDRWEALLDEGVHAVLEMTTSTSEVAHTMRSTSPLKGIKLLTDEERAQVRTAFRTYWESTHKADAA
jgi:excisionase family DNA binding protein